MKIIKLNILFFSLFLMSLLAIPSCSVSPEYQQAKLENVKDKSTDEQIKTYFNILSSVSDNDVGGSFELSYYEMSALNALGQIKEKKHITTFVTALDNDSPVIRQAAINQMQNHEYKPAIPKLIEIMNDDPVQYIQFEAITALTWLNATAACPYLTNHAKQGNRRLVSRVLTALTTIPCPQGVDLLLSYFKTGKINTIRQHLRTKIYGVLSNLEDEAKVFIPYLIKLTHKKNKPNLNVISALQEIGGKEVEMFFTSELNGNNDSDYKYEISRYTVKMNSPSADNAIMNYIDTVTDDEVRRILYLIIEGDFREVKRRRRFVDRLMRNFEVETNKKSRYRISLLLEGLIQKKHIGKIKYFIDNEEYHNSRCQLVQNLANIATVKQFNYLKQFDNPNENYSCYQSVVKYLGGLKNAKVNNYLNLKYLAGTRYQYSYLAALGKYQSPANKSLLFNILKGNKLDGKSTAAIALLNQNVKNDWQEIKGIFKKEKNKKVAQLLLNIIATFNHKAALDTIKQAYNSRLYLTARKILLNKGFTEDQMSEFRQ